MSVTFPTYNELMLENQNLKMQQQILFLQQQLYQQQLQQQQFSAPPTVPEMPVGAEMSASANSVFVSVGEQAKVVKAEAEVKAEVKAAAEVSRPASVASVPSIRTIMSEQAADPMSGCHSVMDGSCSSAHSHVDETASVAAGGGSSMAAGAGGSVSERPFNPVIQTWCDWGYKCRGKESGCRKAHTAKFKEWALTPMKNRCTHGDWNNPDSIKWCPDLSCKKVHHPDTDRTPIKCPYQKEGKTCYGSSCVRNLHEGQNGYKEAKTHKQFKAYTDSC